MPNLVVQGAMLTCTFGAAPGTLNVLPTSKVMGTSLPAANIMDMQPMMNIAPFGMCMSPANPEVAAATAAALGVLTPMPCIPNTAAPWTPGSTTTMIGGMPALTNTCQLMCIWGGQIMITFAGQAVIEVD